MDKKGNNLKDEKGKNLFETEKFYHLVAIDKVIIEKAKSSKKHKKLKDPENNHVNKKKV